MATKLDAEAYKYFKSLPESEWTNEERRAINDYERAEAQAPSNDELEFANFVINKSSKNPSTDGAYYKKTGEYQKALDIIQRDRAYVATKGSRGMDAYVQKVKRIPDDLLKENQFNFNWKSAYENQPNAEKLKDTEADYDRLKKFIDSKMYDVNDPVNLQKIAYELHMYNPNTMKWSEFVNSEQGNEFKKYIKDVEKYQKDKAVEKIFSGEDPTKVNYPLLGPTDIPGSQFLVDFGLPVAKEYAKKNYENINSVTDMAGPLAVDFGTNALMALQPGAKAESSLIARGSDFLAPAVQNIGQVAYNDMDPAAAGANTVVGGAVNIGTPFALNKMNRYAVKPGKGYSQRVEINKATDAIADKVGEIEKRIKDGAVHLEHNKVWLNGNKKIAFTDDPKYIKQYKDQGYTVLPEKQMRDYNPGLLTEKQYNFYKGNRTVLREYRPKNLPINDMYLKIMDEPYKKLIRDVAKGFKTVDNMSKQDLEMLLGKRLSETRYNYLKRNMPDVLKNYLTNMAGRSQMGTGVLSLPQRLLGMDFAKYIEEKKNKKPSISEIFGQ